MHHIRSCAAVGVLMSLVCGVTSGAIVAPGETKSIRVDPLDFVLPTGEVLAEQTLDVTFTYDLTGSGYTPNEETVFDGAITNQVIRDPASGRLVFVYTVTAEDRGIGDERNTFTIDSFAGFTTDIELLGFHDWRVTRSADGATIDADSVDVGDSLLPTLVIYTDATEFDSNGTFSGSAGREMSVIRDRDGVSTYINDQGPYSASGTFQPIADDGGPGNVIPLPAGVWLGLATLGGGAFVRRLRLPRHRG